MSCYWGGREELSAKQREIISDLGYKFRGKNNWLYFMSYEPGYYPYNLDRNEVLRLTSHLENFQLAFTYYLEKKIQIDFENGNMFSFFISKDREKWHFEEEPLPLTSFSFGNLIIEDQDLLAKLKKAPKRNVVLEMEVSPLGASVKNRLNNEYIELLSEDANPSEKFWRLDKRIKEDRKKTGVQLEMSRSNLIYNIISLINEGTISCEDLDEFSDELKEAVSAFVER